MGSWGFRVLVSWLEDSWEEVSSGASSTETNVPQQLHGVLSRGMHGHSRMAHEGRMCNIKRTTVLSLPPSHPCAPPGPKLPIQTTGACASAQQPTDAFCHSRTKPSARLPQPPVLAALEAASSAIGAGGAGGLPCGA